MNKPMIILAVASMALGTATTAEARCSQRISRTQGTVLGAVAGGVLGGVVTHGSTGPIVGAAAGGVLGHSVAGRHRGRCGYYRRTRR
jgi:uncharacterized protein YcfJ